MATTFSSFFATDFYSGSKNLVQKSTISSYIIFAFFMTVAIAIGLATIIKNQFLLPKQYSWNFAHSFIIYYVWEKSDRGHFFEKISTGKIWVIFTMSQFWAQKFWIFATW